MNPKNEQVPNFKLKFVWAKFFSSQKFLRARCLHSKSKNGNVSFFPSMWTVPASGGWPAPCQPAEEFKKRYLVLSSLRGLPLLVKEEGGNPACYLFAPGASTCMPVEATGVLQILNAKMRLYSWCTQRGIFGTGMSDRMASYWLGAGGQIINVFTGLILKLGGIKIDFILKS